MPDDLKSCPFCGDQPRYLAAKSGYWTERVICDNCEFHLPVSTWQTRNITQEESKPKPPFDKTLELAKHQLDNYKQAFTDKGEDNA